MNSIFGVTMINFQKDFSVVLEDMEERYKEKGKKYADHWKHVDEKELYALLCKDYQDLVDEYANSKIYKRVLDVALMSLIVAARIKDGKIKKD
jgi:hypothetical protein